MEQTVFERLQEADWDTLQRKLLVCAMWQAKGYTWHRGDELDLAAGNTIEDVVQEVIVKALSGVRCWDPTRGPLSPWLQAQSRSIIDALAKSASHRHEVGILELDGLVVLRSSDPLETILDEEALSQRIRLVETLFLATHHEPDLQAVLQIILDGCEPRPRHIAAELGVSVDEVNNWLKRLRRRAAKLAECDVQQSQ